jgi:DNA ligase (NAD+)
MAMRAETQDVVDPSERVTELRHLIEEANYNYHVLDQPTIADVEYDALMRELRSLEEEHPELRAEDSPTMRVGGAVAEGFAARRHPRPMLSLGNAFTHEELDGWYRRVRNIIPNAEIDFVVEPKIDGLAIALTYEGGVFRVGATRGNGIEGEDVTPNLRTINEVPLRLQGEPTPARVEVRGEVYMPISGFEQLNERRAREGQALFANPRNASAGSLRQLDSSITRQRPLCLFAYAIGYADGMHVDSQWDALELLTAWGFPVNEHVEHIHTLEEVHAYCDRMAEARESLPYEIDGVVVKISPVVLQEELGVVGSTPRWAIAYKFAPREATTRLSNIDVNVGRTGTINPFAVLEPVNIGGVQVRLATLHNEEDIHRKDIRVGDRVIVRRAGDVIPQVVKPIAEDRDGSQQVFSMPVACPSCGTDLVKPEGEAMHRCPNTACPAQRYRWIEHFVSEAAMDIRGLGEALVRLLLQEDLIRDPADLYSLTEEQLLTLPGIKEKSASNLLRSIELSKQRPLPGVIFALGIRYVGFLTAQLLASLGDLDALAEASVERLEAIEGIGSKTAESVVAWRAQDGNRDLLRRLKQAGVTWRQEPPDEAETGPLTGITFLRTGRLEGMPRSQAEASLRDLGATIAGGMNRSVDYLLAGTDPGSKLDRARKLGTPVKDEAWLVSLLEAGQIPEE